ncbi:ferritin-like domain-containing protein [Streptomyces sp. RB6PN25]|uniref:Ferritin-like domain-containing protein n=1 Tax=Streptomyces humicola TaxID=2953240 RepID=A0ABT1Q3P6_9ACTN|nr:ferritin-like domain-containing protein [Streptomyces humicola]MCQ4084552.1 ferritin-like domain-containing protein [Streptomyces humicola]
MTSPPATSSPAGPGSPASALAAAQAALAAEDAAVYGYGVVGARVGAGRRSDAQAAYDAHRAQRDALSRTVHGLGGEPVAADPAYALPFPVPDQDAAARLAAYIEDRIAGAYADLVRAAHGGLRRDAAAALRGAAVRAVQWRGSGVAFPGLIERAPGASPAASATR